MLITDAQLREIQQIIADHHAAFVASTVSPDAIDPETLERLKAKGLVDVKVRGIDDAYLLGQAAAALESVDVAKMGYDDFKKWVRDNPIPLSEVERRAMQIAALTAGQYAVGLGYRVDLETGNTIREADQALARAMREQIEDATALNIARRETVKQLRSDLGHRTGDWARDLDRIAITELHNAHQEGVADGIADKYGGEAWVFKRPMPDACPACKELHLGDDGQPLIFRLSALVANGTNKGRKRADWLPVVGAVHPHCFPAGTLVETARGALPIESVRPGDRVLSHQGWSQVGHVWASCHDGLLVDIYTNRGTLSATAEHPFCVNGRWVPAHSLMQGEYVLCFTDQISREAVTDTDAIQKPTETMQEPVFASILFGFTRGGMPVTAIDFDGELYLREGQIDQHAFETEIDERLQPNAMQRDVNPAFVGRFEFASLPVEGSTDVMPGLSLASDSGMKGGDALAPLFWRRVSVSEFLGSAVSARCDSGRAQSGSNSAAAALEALGNFLYREQIVKVHRLNGGGFDIFAPRGPAIASHALSVPTTIVSVNRRHYRGLVYNLTVPGPNTFTVNGHLVHNCQCQLSRVPEGWGFNEDGQLVPKGKQGERHETTQSFQERRARYEQLKKGLLAGHTVFQGIPIGVENPAGSVRSWQDATGESGSTRMLYAYGFVEGTNATDGDELDVFVGPVADAPTAFVVHQQNPRTGLYDEDKVMLGFPDEETALLAYRVHYDRPDFEVTVSPITVDHFKRWYAQMQGGPEEGLVEPLRKAPAAPERPRFVIPLSKALRTESGTLEPTYAPQNSPHGNRAPGPNLGVNFLFNTPPRTPPQSLAAAGHHMDPRGMLLEAQKRVEPMKRDKRVYEYKEPLPTACKPLKVPEWYYMDRIVEPEDLEHNKQMAIDFGTRNLQRPRNNVEVGEDASDE